MPNDRLRLVSERPELIARSRPAIAEQINLSAIDAILDTLAQHFRSKCRDLTGGPHISG